MYIYKITNTINGKVYIGQTQKDDPSYFGSGKIIRCAVKKYGCDNFIKEVIEECSSKEELDEREIYWIEFYDSTNRNVGYNITKGGGGGDTFTNNPDKEIIRNKFKENSGNRKGVSLSEETRQRISEGRKGKNTGKRPKEVGEKISAKMKGKVFSEDHKKHLSDKRKLRIITDETRAKASKTSKGKINIKQYELTDPDGNKYITENGLTCFCEEHDLSAPNILKVINGSRPNHKGWTAKRIEST